jgi:hypothetical protein
MEEFGVPFQVGFDKIWNKLEEIWVWIFGLHVGDLISYCINTWLVT